jgi:crossover junction endonuclease MUS81
MLFIIIDSRETNLYNNIIERDLDKYKDKITIIKKQLEIGDICIEIDDNNKIIYERKTITDLLSSIKDGRYKEQKERLLNNYSNINYIIEGTDIIASNNIHNQQLLTSIYYHSIYRDNIKLFFCKNINDTSTLLLMIAIKIIEHPEYFIIKDENKDEKKEYIDICKIKSKKISNIDKTTCYLLQLSQIPGISKEIAKNIKEIYPSLNILINSLNNSDNPIKLLQEIPNIGNKKAITIIEYLL